MSTIMLDRRRQSLRGDDRRRNADRRASAAATSDGARRETAHGGAGPCHYAPLSPAQRSAIGVVALVLCLALTSGVALLFQHGDGAPGWAGLLAPPDGVEPSCLAADPRAVECHRQVARTRRAAGGAASEPMA